MPAGAYLRVETLCYSLNNNEIPLVTISAEDTLTNPIVVSTFPYIMVYLIWSTICIMKIFSFSVMFRLVENYHCKVLLLVICSRNEK